MKQYQTFIFDRYELDAKKSEIRLHYSLDDEVHFTETLILPSPPSPLPNWERGGEAGERVNAALFALHLIGGISYYKTCLPKTIEIRSGTLDDSQALFWNTVYENGLGEFFYRNEIDFRGLIRFPADPHPRPLSQIGRGVPEGRGEGRVLVPIGGGKDSVVTLELLRSAGFDVTLFRLGSHPLIDEVVKVANLPLLSVERKLSGALFELNQQGALNGHIPITAYVSILTVVLSLLYGFDAVTLSNERSANYGNVEYLGKEINHQWSKSLEFERMLQEYLCQYVTNDVQYFSLLRPLSELGITKIFARYPQYFDCTTSCNANWRIIEERPKERWCGKCPKCAFVFTLLAAFVPKEQLVGIFGKNLFEDASLLPLYRQLLNLEGFKPFECVGTPEETLAALILANEQEDWGGTPVMKMAMEEVDLPDDIHALIEQELTPSDDHAIPSIFLKALPHTSA